MVRSVPESCSLRSRRSSGGRVRSNGRVVKEEKRAYWSSQFAKHRSALGGFIRGRIPDPWDAEDLMQEVYWRLLRLEDGERGPIHNVKAYLYTVATNLLRERAVLYRRADRTVDIQDMLLNLVSPDGSAQDAVERQLRLTHLAEVIEQLPPKCRAVLVMQYREEMSYREIADRLGVSVHMVKKHVVRALELCRHGLAGYR